MLREKDRRKRSVKRFIFLVGCLNCKKLLLKVFSNYMCGMCVVGCKVDLI